MHTVDMQTNVGKTLRKVGYKTQRVGLELEYEDCRISRLTQKDVPLWMFATDHSLRNSGIEFVSKPLPRKSIRTQIDRMLEVAKLAECNPNKRCGYHVHVNCTHLTWNELYCFVVYYTLLEPLLFKHFAPGREVSHFCVPTWTNIALTENLYHDGQVLRTGIPIPWKSTAENGCTLTDMMKAVTASKYGPTRLEMLSTPKYGAMNFNSLNRFGTLEFRQAPSSLDPEFLEKWALLLLDIQAEAIKYNEPTDIMLEYDANGIVTLCERVGFFPTKEADDLDQEDAVDAAAIIAGHIPVDWKELKWEMK